MGFLAPDRWFRGQLRASTTPGPMNDFWYGDVWRDPVSGYMVQRGGEELALTLSAFWRGVNLIGSNVAACDCEVFRRLANGDEEKAPNHPVAEIIGRRPNAYQDNHTLWEMCSAHILLRGAFYARIIPDLGGRGFVGQLDPIHPDVVTVDLLPSRELQFTVRNPKGGKPELLGSEDVFYVRGLSLDGVRGVSVIRYGAQSLGVMLAAERFAGRFFKSGATPAMAVVHKDELGATGLDNLHKSINKYVAGLENAFGVLVLEEDVKVVADLGINPEDAQLLATRQFSRQHVADWLNMHIAALGDPATQSYASTRQFRQDLVDLTFRPFVERIEAAIDTQLFIAPQVYFSRFNLREIFRGNPKEQADVDRIYVQDGVRTRNEVRRDHHWNALEGLDEPLTPMNMDRTDGRTASPGRTSDAEGRALCAWAKAHVVLLDESRRIVRAEVGAARRAAKQHAGDAAAWQGWLREFYAEHAREVSERLRLPLPLAREYAARQGTRLSEGGIAACEDWEHTVPPGLASLALCGDSTGRAAALDREAAA
jgi:HK97 family phage portal protein